MFVINADPQDPWLSYVAFVTDPGQVKDALTAIRKRQETYTQRAQAYYGWAINLRSPKHLAYYLYDVEGLKARRTRRA